MSRRTFLKTTVASSLALPIAIQTSAQTKSEANDRIVAAVIGVRGRGNDLLHGFAGRSDIELKYICDVDQNVLDERTDDVSGKINTTPTKITDFRKAIDDDQVDIVVLGTPEHWHAIPTIMACQAGKDVYVEKPDGHNLLEGRAMVAAAAKHNRVVQMGTQARSRADALRAMAYIGEGHLGKVCYAKSWESTRQGSIGKPADSTPPEGVDYDLWLGPAPSRPFNKRRFHGSWRWFFDYGTGDLGNDGVHRMDVARWALSTALEAQGESLDLYPRSVSAYGGKHYFDDDQEWPDNLILSCDYKNSVLTYEMRIWTPYPYYGLSEGAMVYGDEGYIVIGNHDWKAFDADGTLIKKDDNNEDETDNHIQNFIECVRSRKKPNADLETVGHPTSVMCHVGNAAWRAGSSLQFDPDSYTFLNDKQANQYLTRSEYRKPWELPTV